MTPYAYVVGDAFGHAAANREIHPAKPAGWRRVGVPGVRGENRN